jgi:predicted PurR-regulated permease PerM
LRYCLRAGATLRSGLRDAMPKPVRISYVLMGLLLVLIGWLHLGTLLLTVLFGYFVLQRLHRGEGKALAVVLYLAVIAAIGGGLYYFSRKAFVALPTIADNSIVATVNFAQAHHIELPFSDLPTFQTAALNEAKAKLGNLGQYAHDFVFLIAMVLIGLVVAVSLFLDARWSHDDDTPAFRESLYGTVSQELAQRFRTFYRSFAIVIGAQIIISAINAALTAVFLLGNSYPYAGVLIVLTFLCGLLPILGNLLSNTFIIGVGFTIAPRTALFALIFLVVVHKLEYFLNSKIIGDRIKNPMWLILLGLVLGEKLMGIPGMILAPVVLHYVKVEAMQRKSSDLTGAPFAGGDKK